MDISPLYFDGYPNHHETRASLEALLDEAGRDGTIQSVNVDSPERAEALEFRGSPTVLINGDDPFLDTHESCSRQCTHIGIHEGVGLVKGELVWFWV